MEDLFISRNENRASLLGKRGGGGDLIDGCNLCLSDPSQRKQTGAQLYTL